MAQHIELLYNGDWGSKTLNEKIKRVVSGIKKDFSRGLTFIRGSLRYNFEEALTAEYKKFGEQDTLVFSTIRLTPIFPTGSVHPRVFLEIHYNVKKRKIEHIYFVA